MLIPRSKIGECRERIDPACQKVPNIRSVISTGEEGKKFGRAKKDVSWDELGVKTKAATSCDRAGSERSVA
jgi:hypothetical protein